MKNILIMAGGTGGHIFPALAVADILKEKGANIQWLGTEKGMEFKLVAEHHYPVNTIEIGGLRGKGIKTLLLLPFKLTKAIMQTFKVYKRVQPDVILGMGGFVTGPGGLVGWLLAKPLVLHEQNAIAGLTNKILYRMSQTVFAAFPGAFPEHYKQSKLKVIGNPVRKEIVELIDPEQYYKHRWSETERAETERVKTKRVKTKRVKTKRAENSGDLNILVVGGSLGATALNEKVPQALALIEKQLSKMKDFNCIKVRHQCGKNNLEQTKGYYKVLPEASKIIDVEIMEFISDMATNYQWADLVICRSGALTVSEIAAAGVASILVPFPIGCLMVIHSKGKRY